MDIEHEDAVAFESAKDGRGAWPEGTEELKPFGEPGVHDVLGEREGVVELGGGEVEDEGGFDNRDFQDAELVVPVDQARYGVRGDISDAQITDSPIDIAFAGVGGQAFVDLEGGTLPRCPDATIFPEAEALRRHACVPSAVGLETISDGTDKLVHSALRGQIVFG